MLARRLALVVALVAVLALVAFLVMRGDGEIERRDSTPTVSAEAASGVQVDLASAPDGGERSAAEGPGAESLSTAAASIGRTFADLVRPLAHRSVLPLGDATIVCTTFDGVQRSVRGGDTVLASDLEPRGLWIVTAPDRCPRIIDPAAIARCLASGGTLPVDVELLASATLTLHFGASSPERGGIERVVLTTGPRDNAVPSWLLDGEFPQHEDPLDAASVVGEIEALARGGAAQGAAADSVGRVRAHWLGDDESTNARPPTNVDSEEVQAWAWRYIESPNGTSVALQHVPAELRLTIGASSGPLVITQADGTAIACSADRYTVRSTEFQLVAGESREFFVRQVAPAIVRGRMPPNALGNERLRLAADERRPDGRRLFSYRAVCHPPSQDTDGSFEWPALDAGFYEFTASWEEPGGVHRHAAHEFELVAGQVYDLGELAPQFAGRLTLTARLEGETSGLLTTTAEGVGISVLVNGPIDLADGIDPLEAGAPARGFTMTFTEPYVLDGIEPGLYRVKLRHLEMGAIGADNERDRAVVQAELLEALERGADPRLLQLTNMGAASLVEVSDDTHHEVVARVAPTGACTLTVPIPALPERRQRSLSVEFIRADGSERREGGQILAGTDAHVASTGTLTQFLPPGEWTAIVAYELESTLQVPSEHSIARVDFVIASGVHTTETANLEPAARLRLPNDYGGSFEIVLADLGDRSHAGVQLVQSPTGRVFEGLLPHTRYSIDDRTIETGAAGSDVVLE